MASTFVDRLTSVQGRITAGVAMAVAITAGLWPDHARHVDPVRLGAVVTTALAWLFAELAGAPAPSPHDIALFERITTSLPEDMMEFLRQHDFAGSFADPGFPGIWDIAGWEGARREFRDTTLRKAWAPVQAEIRSLSNYMATNIYPKGNLFTVHPDIGDPENPEPFIEERIKHLNDTSTAVAAKVDEFERLARQRLRL